MFLEKEDIRLALQKYGEKNTTITFLNIIGQTGFLVPTEPGRWEFAHKQIAEYLVADYLQTVVEVEDQEIEEVLNVHKKWLFYATGGRYINIPESNA